MDMMEALIAYEEDALGDEQTIELFQQLVNTGMAWKLQGHYGRMAMFLIDNKLITLPPSKEIVL